MDSLLLEKIWEHVEITAVALLISILLGIPLGVLAARKARCQKIIISVTNILWTIPSIALFGMIIFMPVVGGIGYQPSIFVLFIYSTIPIIQNTFQGMSDVSHHHQEIAQGIGMSKSQMFWIIEFPIALPSIVRGIRFATITNISTATLACLIGAGGLGDYIFLGLQTQNTALVFKGAIPAILLALGGSFFLKLLEQKISDNVLLKLQFYEKYSYIGYLLLLFFILAIISFFYSLPASTSLAGQTFSFSNIWPTVLKILSENRIWEHLEMTLTVVFLATIVGVPFSIWMSNKPRASRWIIRFLDSFESIPSPALFGLTIAIPWIGGVGYKAAIFAISLYALVPIIRETYIGITEVPDHYQEVSKSLGMSSRQILQIVIFPSVFPAIMRGIQKAIVLAVWLAAIAAMIGSGGLGTYIYYGIRNGHNELIFVGSIFMVLLAMVVEKFSLWVTMKSTGNIIAKSYFWKRYYRIKLVTIAAFTIFITGLCFTNYSNISRSQNSITIATKNFTESHILAEILKQYIQNHSNLNVNIQNYEGLTLAFKAMQMGDVDMYVEYTGTAYNVILKKEKKQSPDLIFKEVQNEFRQHYQLEWMPRLGFENSFALAMSQQMANNLMSYHKIKDIRKLTISHLVPVAEKVVLGCRSEFLVREDTFIGLQKKYDLNFKEIITSELRYQLLSSGKSDVIDAYTTDGQIKQLGLVVLKDDKHYFPPYEAAPVVRTKTVEKHPQIQILLRKLTNQISTEEMCEMNYLVDIEQQKIKQVAKDFLLKKHLIKE